MKKAERIKDAAAREERLAVLGEEKCEYCNLPSPSGWPIIDNKESAGGGRPANVLGHGLPHFKLLIQVDFIGKFKFDRDASFQSSLGELPARATFELTGMIYKTTSFSSDGRELLPRKIFMGDPELISEYDRGKRYVASENTLDAFYTAGCYSKQYTNVMQVLFLRVLDPLARATPDKRAGPLDRSSGPSLSR